VITGPLTAEKVDQVPQRLKPFFKSKPLTQRLKRCSTQNQTFAAAPELAPFPNFADTDFSADPELVLSRNH
jgi:hypothetical protein